MSKLVQRSLQRPLLLVDTLGRMVRRQKEATVVLHVTLRPLWLWRMTAVSL